MQPESRAKHPELRELALLFLRLGATAFGGPAAHLAMLEDEVVARRGWLTRREFLDLNAAANFIPGPNSTELAIHVGYRRAGWPGLLVAGTCFILPAALIVWALAWAYVHFGRLPQVAGLLYGVKPVVIAIIAQALWRLGRACIRSRWMALLALAAFGLALAGVHELLVLFGAAVVVLLARGGFRNVQNAKLLAALPAGAAGAGGAAAAATAAGMGPLFLAFLKIGSVLFGSGYVLIAFLRSDFVDRFHWLTNAQLLDAVAVGQVTPGPLFTTATFIGYVLHGNAGALAATLGIFLPAFFFVAVTAPLLPRLQRSPAARALLDGINTGSVALIAAVTLQLARGAFIDWLTLALGAASLLALLRTRLNSSWLVLAGGVIGLLVRTKL